MSSVWPRARSRLREARLARTDYEQREASTSGLGRRGQRLPGHSGQTCGFIGAACRPLARNALPLPPAAAGLRPLEQMVDGAEAVGDAMLAAVANQDDADVVELFAALRAGGRPLLDGEGLDRLAGLPVSALDCPRHHVLEPTEGGPALTGGLIQAEAVVCVDARAAPRAALSRHGYPRRPWRRSG